MNILADASLPELAIAFPAPFHLSLYHDKEECQAKLTKSRILLCRSTLKVDAAFLDGYCLDWILTASSGSDHLDKAFLSKTKTKILDAKGSNADAVVSYVLATIAYLKLEPKTVGIVGIGEVGSRLFHHFTQLGISPCGYDPLKALHDPKFHSSTLEEIAQCALICLHPNLHSDAPYPSYHLINRDFLNKLSQNTVMINASRGQVVDEDALLTNFKGLYCTDVYANEPDISKLVVQFATTCTPHIAGHTIQAKIEAVRMLSRQLHQTLGLTCPTFPPLPLVSSATYSPQFETQQFKSAKDVKETFLRLRKNHIRS